MDIKISDMFFYILDNWIVCAYIVCLGLHYKSKVKRYICLVIVAISLFGHFVTPIVFNLDNSKQIWELYGASINFAKLAGLFYLTIISTRYKIFITKVLMGIFAFNVIFRTVAHIDWVILETNVLADVYPPLVQFMNIVVAVVIFGDWLFEFVNSKLRSRYGVHQPSDDDSSFSACVGNIPTN